MLSSYCYVKQSGLFLSKLVLQNNSNFGIVVAPVWSVVMDLARFYCKIVEYKTFFERGKKGFDQ